MWINSACNIMLDEKFNGTILQQYLTHNNGIKTYWNESMYKPDYRLLRKFTINVSKKKYALPLESELVIYIRSGDILMFTQHNSTSDVDFYIERIEEYLKKHIDIRKITVVTCFQFNIFVDQYLVEGKERMRELFVALLEKFPCKQVNVQSSIIPDEDFTYAALAKHLICSRPSLLGDGLAGLIREVNNLTCWEDC